MESTPVRVAETSHSLSAKATSWAAWETLAISGDPTNEPPGRSSVAEKGRQGALVGILQEDASENIDQDRLEARRVAEEVRPGHAWVNRHGSHTRADLS